MKDGGPAFPCNKIEQAWGMSMRDFFAAAALNGVVTDWSHDPELAATYAYKIADAMLSEREKQ